MLCRLHQQTGPLEEYTDEELMEACHRRLNPTSAHDQEQQMVCRTTVALRDGGDDCQAQQPQSNASSHDTIGDEKEESRKASMIFTNFFALGAEESGGRSRINE